MLEQGPDFWCYQCKICWNKALTFGVGSIQLSFRIYIPLCSPNTCKYVFNPNVTTFQSNCAEGLHFSAFIIIIINTFINNINIINNNINIINNINSDRRAWPYRPALSQATSAMRSAIINNNIIIIIITVCS